MRALLRECGRRESVWAVWRRMLSSKQGDAVRSTMGLGAESDEVEKVVKVAASKGDVNTISEAIGRLREKGACLEDNFYVVGHLHV
mmetsp:Transcript_1945/g.5824  ORF Transcript_1945/g.5824 Transcript_1945/m.5824 type:complete len:86 (-) Transcript_1945:1826-2083(-)